MQDQETTPAHLQEHILQFFSYAHLPPDLAKVSEPFCTLAEGLIWNLPRNPERTVALRKLLEAKDAAVRAFIALPAALAACLVFAVLLGGCATTGKSSVHDPGLAARIGGFAVCQRLGSQEVAKVNAAGDLLTGGKSPLPVILAALLNGLSPRDAALAAFVIDTGALADVLPDLSVGITSESAAGKQIESALAGCRLGAAAANVLPKAESAESDVSLALARYEAAKFFAAHPELAR